jgi:hypothetical protein
MMLAELKALLDATSPQASAAELKAAVIDENVAGKNTLSGRQRTYRYLRELYALDPGALVFRSLRDLWEVDPQAQPLLALLASLARDPLLRATSSPILEAPLGAGIGAADLAAAVQAAYPDSYNDSIAAKIGRNAASSWTQSGHLVGRAKKTRARVQCLPAAVAYALLIGYTEGRRGALLFDTLWCRILDCSKDALLEQVRRASQRGLVELKHGGGVTEVTFRMLLRPFDTAAQQRETTGGSK